MSDLEERLRREVKNRDKRIGDLDTQVRWLTRQKRSTEELKEWLWNLLREVLEGQPGAVDRACVEVDGSLILALDEKVKAEVAMWKSAAAAREEELQRYRGRLMGSEAEVARLKDELDVARDEDRRAENVALTAMGSEAEVAFLALDEKVKAEVARLRNNCAHWNDIYDNSCTEVARLRAALERIVEVGGRNGYAARIASEALGAAPFDEKEQSTKAD